MLGFYNWNCWCCFLLIDGFEKLIDDGLTAGTVQAERFLAALGTSNIFDIIGRSADVNC